MVLSDMGHTVMAPTVMAPTAMVFQKKDTGRRLSVFFCVQTHGNVPVKGEDSCMQKVKRPCQVATVPMPPAATLCGIPQRTESQGLIRA